MRVNSKQPFVGIFLFVPFFCFYLAVNAFAAADAVDRLAVLLKAEDHTKEMIHQLAGLEGKGLLMEIAKDGASSENAGKPQAEINQMHEKKMSALEGVLDRAEKSIDVPGLTKEWMAVFKNHFSEGELNKLATYLESPKDPKSYKGFIESGIAKKYENAQKDMSAESYQIIQAHVRRAVDASRKAAGV